jgi:hypothetical protein
MRSFFKNLSLGIVVLIVVLVIVEIVFRLIFGSPLAPKGQGLAQRKEGEAKYTLTANLDRQYAGVRVVTNSLGLRDYRPPSKSSDKEQILVLGDSFTFGYGVPLEGSYPYRLEQLLNGQAGADEYEVINAGVPGYDTVDEFELLQTILPEYSPRWIIVGLHPGDFMSREEIQHRPLVRWREALRYKSAFFAWFLRFYRTRMMKYVPPPKSLLSVDPDSFFKSREAARIRNALKQTSNLAASNEADLVVFMIVPLVHWDRYPYKNIHAGLSSFCEENSIYFVDPLDEFSGHDPGSLWLTSNDSHYSTEANRIAAKALHKFFQGVRQGAD